MSGWRGEGHTYGGGKSFALIIILRLSILNLRYRSVHNTRIERLWVDVKTQVVSRWADTFRDLEESHGLDIENESHIWLLQEVFLPMLNTELLTFQTAWSNHSLRRSGQELRTPAELFVLGMYEHGIRGHQLPQHALRLAPRDGPTMAPEHLNGVEVNPPERTDERLFLSRRVTQRITGGNGRARGVHEIWSEALIECRMVYPTVF